jgi:hypothetical protein
MKHETFHINKRTSQEHCKYDVSSVKLFVNMGRSNRGGGLVLIKVGQQCQSQRYHWTVMGQSLINHKIPLLLS